MLSLLRRKLQKHYGNEAIGTRILIYTHFCAYMAFHSGTSSFLPVAVNATLEDSSFKMGSELAAHSHEAAETLRFWCENEMNQVPYTEFSCLLLKELDGALPTNVTFSRENVWTLFLSCVVHLLFNLIVEIISTADRSVPTPVLYQHLTDPAH